MKINAIAALACLIVSLIVGALWALDPTSTRGWQYNSGEEIQLGSGRSIVLSSESSALIEVPMEHVSGDLDPAFLPVRIYGPSDEVYDVSVGTQASAQKAIEGDKQLVEDGEVPDLKTGSFASGDIRAELTIMGPPYTVVRGYIWTGSCDPIWIRASDNKALSRLIAQGGSAEEIAQLILDGIGLRWNGNRLLE